MQHIIEACSPSPFHFTADVRYEERKKKLNMMTQHNVLEEVAAYMLEISAKKRNSFPSGSAKNSVDVTFVARYGVRQREN